jgi:hypothetical protein
MSMMLRRARSAVRVLLPVGLLAVGSPLFAQDGPPNGPSVPQLGDQILQAIATLQTSVTALQGSVTSLQTDVDTLTAAAEATVRFTPKVFFRLGVLDCAAVNVASAARHIRISMINAGTGALVTDDAGTIAIPAGSSRSVGVFSSAFTGSAFCRFEVLDGTATDMRGDLVIGANGTNDTTLVSVPAF